MVEKSLFDEEPLQWSSEEAVPREPGVYAIFLSGIRNTPESWRADLLHKRDLLYIGKGETGLRSRLRSHFAGKDSLNSSFRQSVGAMLRTTLDLKPIYHNEGQQENGNYSFRQEELLSNWIQEHCSFTFSCVRPEDIENKGYELIKVHNPPLNIVDNEQFCHPKLRGARNECAELAKDSLNIREYMIDKFPCNAPRYCWNSGANIPNKKGLVAIFLKEGEEHEQAVPKGWRTYLISTNRLLYIGYSGKLREYIEHSFSYNDKYISTIQQILYTILCSSAGASEKEQYLLDGGKLLLSWMREHCTFAYCECEEAVIKKKIALVKQYTPPFNKVHNPHPHPLLERHTKQIQGADKNSPNKFPFNVPRYCWNGGANIPNKKGLVAIFLKEGEEHEQAVPQEWRKGLIRANRLLYIGLSEKMRQYLGHHFSYNDKGMTAFQQIIYAMLCSSIGASEKEQYLLDDGKLLLSWIWEHCAFAYCECEEEVKKKKKELIKQYTPPLNRSDNPRPHPLLEGYMKQIQGAGKNSPNKFPLNAPRYYWNSGANIPNKKGLVAIFLKEGEEHEQAVPEGWRKELISDKFIRNARLLYIGAANLQSRLESHFSANRSIKDTFRRSVGAMLYRILDLKPTGANEDGEYYFYGEGRLSNWIQTHCAFAYYEHELEEEEASKKKEELIKEYTPPFNIENNKKFCHPKLRKARNECLEIAGK